MKKALLLILLAGWLTSCSMQPRVVENGTTEPHQTYSLIDAADANFWEGSYAYAVNAYVPSQRNIEALRKLKRDGKALGLVVVAPFKRTFRCRKAYTIQAGAPVRHSFAYLLQTAMNTELNASGLVESQRLRTRMKVNEFDFSTIKTNGWVISATLRRRGKKPLTIAHSHPIPFALTASSVCHNTVVELNAAIQDFLYAVYTHPRFVEFAQYTPYTGKTKKRNTRFIQRKRNALADNPE